MFKVKMGQKVTDKVTGFTGIVTARAEYLTGCRQYLVQSKGKKNKYGDNCWLDEDRICQSKTQNSGGPQMNSAPIK